MTGKGERGFCEGVFLSRERNTPSRSPKESCV